MKNYLYYIFEDAGIEIINLIKPSKVKYHLLAGNLHGLEGSFICSKEVSSEDAARDILLKEKTLIERKYHGKFVPFE